MQIDAGTSNDVRAAVRPPVKSAVRVMNILEALANSPHGLGFSQLAQELQLPKSSLHELLAVLTGYGYIVFDPADRTYSIGIRLWEHGQAFSRQRDLLHEARPIMEKIVRAINETVQLATLDDIENVYLDKVDCSHPLRLQSDVGGRLPAYATGLGKALLAELPAEEVRHRFKTTTLTAYTPCTLTRLEDLQAELAITAEQGFAIDDQEYTWGLRCVAVPIQERGQHTTTALSASIPAMRARPDQIASALRAIATGSLELSRRLGVVEEDPRLRSLTTASAEVVAARLRHDDAMQEEVRPIRTVR
jgi:DNA-binding IclR family transcriptional regulator